MGGSAFFCWKGGRLLLLTCYRLVRATAYAMIASPMVAYMLFYLLVVRYLRPGAPDPQIAERLEPWATLTVCSWLLAILGILLLLACKSDEQEATKKAEQESESSEHST